MYRSVTPSRLRGSGNKRAVHMVQGLAVALAVLAAVLVLFSS